MSVAELEKSKEISTACVLEVTGYEDGPSDPLLRLREDFIGRFKGWIVYTDGKTDRDGYDGNPSTVHVTSTDPTTGKIIASLRLTETTVEDSLSWSMLSDEAKKAAQESGLLPSDNRRVMDMTRLVVDMNALAKDRKRELARILGVAVNLSDKNTTWVFTLDVGFAGFLESMNVPFQKIVTGSSSSEKGDSVIFGSIEPVRQVKDVKSSFGEIALEQMVARP